MPTGTPSLSSVAVLRSGATVLAGSMAVNVLNYAFTLVMGRLLPISAFGELAALFALQLVTGVPAATITTIAAKFAGQFSGSSQIHHTVQLYHRGRRMSIWLAGGTLVVLLLLTPLLSTLLRIPVWPVALFTGLCAIGPCVALQQGMLQGLQRFSASAVLTVLPTVAKLALGVAFVGIGWGVEGVLLALIAGALFATAYGWWTLRSLEAGAPSADSVSLEAAMPSAVPFPDADIRSYSRVILLLTFLAALFTNVDILLAKAFLSPEAAGGYGGLTVASRVVLYGAGAFSAIVVPLVAASHQHTLQRTRTLQISLAAAMLLATGVATGFTLFPELAVQVLLGSAYAAVAPLLPGLAWAMVLGVLGGVLTNYLIGRESRSVLYPLALGLAAEVLLLAVAHAQASDYVLANLVCNAVFAAAAVYFTLRERRDA